MIGLFLTTRLSQDVNWSRVDVDYFDALILTAPIHYTWSIGEKEM